MSFLGNAKDLYKMRQQANQLKKELKNIHIEAEADGVTVTVDGEQNFISCKISDEIKDNTFRIEQAFIKASNKAVKKAQQIATEKMKVIMSGSGLPGMEEEK